MNIEFLGTKVKSFSLEVGDKNDEIIKDDFQLSFNNGFSENEKAFIVTFTLHISSLKEAFTIDLEYIGFFSAEEAITEEFRKSHFPTVNAPAIAYPFMRSFINTVTVNANLNPVTIPTINFQELVRQQNNKDKPETK